MNKQSFYIFSIFTLLLLFTGCNSSEPGNTESESDDSESTIFSSQYSEMKVTKITGGFEHPWALAFLPDGRMLLTERVGRLNIIDNGNSQVISGTPTVNLRGQGGLLDVSVHPDYESNGWIYLTYSKPNGTEEGEGEGEDEGEDDDNDSVDDATTLIRAKIDGNSLTNVEEIFSQDRYSSPGRHYGSRLAWTLDGKLLMSIGDRGADPPRAQDLSDHAGSVLRLNDDGSAPEDNPFYGDDNAHDEIYSYGHRNIQGMFVHPETGEIWATEHGPRGGDELNRIEAGNNYGWPIVTLGRDYGSQGEFPNSEARTREGMVDPIYEFLPAHNPSGLAVITSDNFSEKWVGNILAGGLRSERIRRLVIEGDVVLHDEELLLKEIGRIRDVRVGPDDNIYIVADHPTEGALYIVEPNN